MSDSKAMYSDASSDFVEKDVRELESAAKAYSNSKAREAKHNDQWKKNPVNLNEVVDRYTPGSKGEKVGVKYIYRGGEYNVIADMASGYVRVYDTSAKKYLTKNGVPGADKDTHFKIKRREEM